MSKREPGSRKIRREDNVYAPHKEEVTDRDLIDFLISTMFPIVCISFLMGFFMGVYFATFF